MGDAADAYNEEGEAAYDAHLRGDCDEMDCPYCEEEAEELEEIDFDEYQDEE